MVHGPWGTDLEATVLYLYALGQEILDSRALKEVYQGRLRKVPAKSIYDRELLELSQLVLQKVHHLLSDLVSEVFVPHGLVQSITATGVGAA
jgi:hypothetical protein